MAETEYRIVCIRLDEDGWFKLPGGADPLHFDYLPDGWVRVVYRYRS